MKNEVIRTETINLNTKYEKTEGINSALNWLFEKLKRDNVKYCVLHSYETLPDFSESDIDICIERRFFSKIPFILSELENATGWTVVQKIQHEYNCEYYVLYKLIDNKIEFLQLDFCTDYVRDKRICIENEKLLSDIREYKNFYIPSISNEILYLTIKKVLKQNIREKQKETLHRLIHQNQEVAYKTLNKYFNEYYSNLLINSILDNNWIAIERNFKELRKHLLKSLLYMNFKGVIKYYYKDLIRRINRCISPTGLHVVLLGPDGVGKTSVSYYLSRHLRAFFRRFDYYHLKPKWNSNNELRKGSSGKIFEFDFDYKPTKRDKVISYFRVLYHFIISYILLYWLKIYPQKIKSSLILFDRYHYDYAIFPLSKKYFGSITFLWNFIKLLPQPDLTIYLSCAPEIIIRRKNELNIEEIRNQQKRVSEFSEDIKNFSTIDAEQSLDRVCLDVALEILNFMSVKYKKLNF